MSLSVIVQCVFLHQIPMHKVFNGEILTIMPRAKNLVVPVAVEKGREAKVQIECQLLPSWKRVELSVMGEQEQNQSRTALVQVEKDSVGHGHVHARVDRVVDNVDRLAEVRGDQQIMTAAWTTRVA